MTKVRTLDSAWLIAAVVALALGACGKADNHAKASDPSRGAPPPPSASSTPSNPPPQTAQAGKTDANAGETAKSTDQPMKSMDKDEEQKAMPQPGQANDHSTVAQDPKPSKEEK